MPSLTRLLWPGALSLLAAVPFLTTPMPVTAQGFFAPPNQRNGLTNEDLDRMNAAAMRLYSDRPAGSVEDWRNPKTHNTGSVKLLRRFTADGMPCWRLEYTIRFQRAANRPRQYRVNWCKTAAGEFKMVEHPSHMTGE